MILVSATSYVQSDGHGHHASAPETSYNAISPSYDTPSTGYEHPSTGYEHPSTGMYFPKPWMRKVRTSSRHLLAEIRATRSIRL